MSYLSEVVGGSNPNRSIFYDSGTTDAKPLSLLHLGLSDGRSNMQQHVTFDAVEKAVRLLIENMDNAIIAWEDIHPKDKDYNLAGIAPEARKIVGYIIRNGPRS
jgi:hypothetical protein